MVNKKSIMIFGAGLNQIELIREANKLGFITIVLDPAEDPPGKKEAKFYYKIKGDDYEKTKKIALKHNVVGIVTGQMEKPMRLMAKLASEMGYIFHSPEVVDRSLNKALMKKAFVKEGVPCAKGLVFSKNESITYDKIKNFNYPLIIKPVDAFSSRGVKKVNSFKELLLFSKQSREFSKEFSIIVEEFIEGREFSVESITYRGKTTIIQITEKFITPYPYTVEIAHLQPARISIEEKKSIEDITRKAINAIGIDNSASHTEVMLTKNGPFIIEIGARLGGDFIGSYLTKASTGISLDRAAVQVALGIEPSLKSTLSKYSMIKYIQFEKGKRIIKIQDFDEIKKMEGFVFMNVFVKEGDVIPELTHSGERVACILFANESYKALVSSLNRAEQLLKSKIILS